MSANKTGAMMVEAGPPKPLRLFLLSHLRTASNLFIKLFSQHPQVKPIVYPFLYAHFGGPDAQVVRQGDESSEGAQNLRKMQETMQHATYQFVLDKLERDVAEAEAEVSL